MHCSGWVFIAALRLLESWIKFSWWGVVGGGGGGGGQCYKQLGVLEHWSTKANYFQILKGHCGDLVKTKVQKVTIRGFRGSVGAMMMTTYTHHVRHIYR